MEWKLFWQIAFVALGSVGLAILLGGVGKSGADKFDERQMVERGKAAQLAMTTVMVYLLVLYAGSLFDWIAQEHLALMAIFGLILTELVHGAYCILHDAYLERGQEAAGVIAQRLALGSVWLLMGWFQWGRDALSAWFDFALGIGYASDGVFLLVRGLMLRIEEKRDEKE